MVHLQEPWHFSVKCSIRAHLCFLSVAKALARSEHLGQLTEPRSRGLLARKPCQDHMAVLRALGTMLSNRCNRVLVRRFQPASGESTLQRVAKAMSLLASSACPQISADCWRRSSGRRVEGSRGTRDLAQWFRPFQKCPRYAQTRDPLRTQACRHKV